MGKRHRLKHLFLAALFCFAALFGLAEVPAPGPAAPAAVPPAAVPPAAVPVKARLAAIPGEVRPGEPVTVAFYADNPANSPDFRAVLVSPKGNQLGRAVFFDYIKTSSGIIMAAILPVPTTIAFGAAQILIEKKSEVIEKIPLTILSRDFEAEEIRLNEKNTNIRTVPDPQKTKESEILWAILNNSGKDVYAEGPFSAPVKSTRRTSHFGDRRVYLYSTGTSDTAIHAGIDYGVPTGTQVNACAPGKVVLAAFRITTGNSVILEHLPGVYSIYYHLDKISVAGGSIVQAGAVLGESGSTGLATGPHLHWEIRIAGENTDPDALVGRPLLDKNAIIAIIGL